MIGGMARSVRELRALTDEALIDEHDKLAPYVGDGAPGIFYYLDELRRRDAERAEAAAYNLARRAYWLTVASTALAVVSIITAITAIILTT